jgi:dolichol-phosphate mannosyltransferase
VKLAVVIPMYNEERGARTCVEAITAVTREDPRLGLVVVDDGSADETVTRLREAQAAGLEFDLVEGGVNRGYGGAIGLGAKRAGELGAEWVLFMDSDLTNPPTEIARFVDAAAEEVDVVKASRFGGGGAMVGVPMKRRIFSVGGNVVARLLVGGPHRDVTNGFRAIRTARYLELELTERAFPVIVEEMYHARVRNWPGVDVPSVLTSRTEGTSSFRYSRTTLWHYLRWPLKTAGVRLRRLVRLDRR